MRYRLFHPAAALAALLASLSLACPASATVPAPLTTVEGQRLEIALACAGTLSVHTDSELKNAVRGHWPQNTTLTHQPDGTLRLTLETCPAPSAAPQASATLDITTPADMPLAIEAPQAQGMTLDNRTGPVVVHAGAGLTQLGTAETLDLISEATGQITIPTLPESARLRSTGSANITVNKANGTALSVYLGGASAFMAHSGKLKALEITSASTQDAIFHGETEVAALHVENSGSIIVDKASGTLATERDGPGQILVNQPQGSPSGQPGAPSGHQPAKN